MIEINTENVNRDAVRQLVEALRSEEYEQATGHLVVQDVSEDLTVEKVRYCCLGVAAEVCVKANVLDPELSFRLKTTFDNAGEDTPLTRPEYKWGSDARIDSEGELLPRPVNEWFGFDYRNPRVKVTREVLEGIQRDGSESAHRWAQRRLDMMLGDQPYAVVEATECNDELQMTFSQIADAFERTYLADGD